MRPKHSSEILVGLFVSLAKKSTDEETQKRFKALAEKALADVEKKEKDEEAA